MGTTLKLNRDAATALLKEARRDFENGAQELWRANVNDETQRPIIEATVEVIGKLAELVDSPRRWPQGDPNPWGETLPVEAEVEFTANALDWMERNRQHQEAFVADLERGEWSGSESGYLPEQVYLLHVLETLVGQRDAEAVAA